MRSISFRDLRNSPSKVQDMLRSDDVALIARGKTVALLVPVGDEDLEQVMQGLKLARAHLALGKMRRDAAASGADRLTPSEIDEEIRATRKHRNPPSRSPRKRRPSS
ncbi:MAG: hypothetical protein ACR2FO_04080 [Actinomycetota bacterium]